MRVERVFTNRSCNQNCGFCTARAPRDDRFFVTPHAVRARIDAALSKGAETIVLTGGEPTLRRDLVELVAYAKKRGALRIELETNATLLDDARANALAEAGLDLARVHVPTWGPELDHITQDPGGFDAMRAGIAALADANIRIEVSAPVVAATERTLPELPAQLASAGVEPAALVLGVPVRSPDPSLLLPLSRAAAVVEKTEASARRVGLDLSVDASALIPPCFFEHPARVAHLFSFTRGGGPKEGWSHTAVCDDCTVRDRCPGFPEVTIGRFDEASVRPIRSDRVRRRLSIISTVAEQVRRELFQEDVNRHVDGTQKEYRIVRVNFRCNQACDFCFVSTHLPTAEDAQVEEAIRGIAERGGKVVLSGGEPTLNPRLVEYVKLSRSFGASDVELQSNAIRLADPALTAALLEAGVNEFFISLHAARAETSDAITNAPGTFDKSCVGIDELVRQGAAVWLNFVFCQLNHREFPSYVEMVADRWPQASIVVSFVAPSSDVVPHTPELIPRYRDVMPDLAEGVKRAAALGVSVGGFESMCGIPLCLVPPELSHAFELADIRDGLDRGEFVHPDECGRCALQTKCFGLRRGYAELHGAEELRPVAQG